MARWQQVKIGDICVVERGGSPRPIEKFITNDSNGINWIKIGDTTESMYITKTAQKIIPEGAKKSRFVQSGDFLLSNSMSFGRPYILSIDGCIHDGWLVLRDKDNLFDKHYLYYCLSAPVTYTKLKSMAVGGVVNNLNSEMVRNVKIPLPPLEEQRRIAALLDKVSDLITKRRAQLDKLDLLVKARFVEMFGDITANPKGWKKEKLMSHIDMITGFPFNSSGYSENGVKICGGLIIMPDRIKWDECKFWPDSLGYEQFLLQEDDIVVALDRPWISEGFKIGEIKAADLPALLIQRTARIRGRDITQQFLLYSLKDKAFEQHCTVTGSLVPHISNKDINSFEIILPPFELQQQFEEFSQKIKSFKLTAQKSIDRLETLKKALIQQYLG